MTSLKQSIENEQAIVQAEYEMKAVKGKLFLTYVINNEGAVKVTQKMEAGKEEKVSDMFRFGMQMQMPENFNEVEYYGRGPVENYADRNHSTLIGKYRQTVVPVHPSARNRYQNRFALVESIEYQRKRSAVCR